MWHVSSRSGVATLRTAIHLLRTYLLMGMMLSGVCKQTETSSCSGDYGRSYVYRVDRVGLCDYMINFIHRLRSLPETYMMNSVLENFTVLQVILYFSVLHSVFFKFRGN